VRVFGADVDVAERRARGHGGDRHALDQHVGIAFHRHPVGISARVAFVGIADDVLLFGLRGGDGLPLDRCGEGCTATATQAGVHDFLHHSLGRQRQGAAQAHEAVMRFIVGD
jgi:hypothetical protein